MSCYSSLKVLGFMERVMIFIYWKADDNICYCQDVHIQEEASVVFNRAKQVIRQIQILIQSLIILYIFLHSIAYFKKACLLLRMALKFFSSNIQLAPFLQAKYHKYLFPGLMYVVSRALISLKGLCHEMIVF